MLMNDLTTKKIKQFFKDFGLENEEKREQLRRLSLNDEKTLKTSHQVFIRSVTSTTPERE
ncbi:hypothetical protein ACFL55_03395 [Candidatus Latescibacterota bacterium]